MRSLRSALTPACVLLLLLAGCRDSSESEQDASATTTVAAPSTEVSVVAPGGDWSRADPSVTRIDPARVEALDVHLRDESDCMAVIEDGQIVRDAYWSGSSLEEQHEVFSVTKSITSTLVGIAQGEGLLDIDEPASRFITEWVDTPSAAVTDPPARLERLRSVLEPGQRLQRADPCARQDGLCHRAHATGRARNRVELQQRGDPDPRRGDLAPRACRPRSTRVTRLFEPTGMRTTMTKDPTGNTMTFMGAKASCLDLARFGYLLLQGGRWGDRQVVPSEWVDEATTPSTDLNRAYGFLFWLNQPGVVKTPTGGEVQGPIWPDAPIGTYAALGLGGQTVLVLPDQGLVVTRIAGVQGGVGQQSQVGGADPSGIGRSLSAAGVRRRTPGRTTGSCGRSVGSPCAGRSVARRPRPSTSPAPTDRPGSRPR